MINVDLVAIESLYLIIGLIIGWVAAFIYISNCIIEVNEEEQDETHTGESKGDK